MIVSLKASHVPTAVECYTQYAAQSDYPDPRRASPRPARGSTARSRAPRASARSSAGHRRHDPRLAAGRPGPRDRRRLRHPPRLRPPGHQARGRRLPDLRPARHRPGADRRRGRGQDEGPCQNPLRISILGCLVNGFGEAKEADLGIAAGSGKGIIFKRGVPDPPRQGSRDGRRPCSRRSSGSTRRPSRWPRSSKRKSRSSRRRRCRCWGERYATESRLKRDDPVGSCESGLAVATEVGQPGKDGTYPRRSATRTRNPGR